MRHFTEEDLDLIRTISIDAYRGIWGKSCNDKSCELCNKKEEK